MVERNWMYKIHFKFRRNHLQLNSKNKTKVGNNCSYRFGNKYTIYKCVQQRSLIFSCATNQLKICAF